MYPRRATNEGDPKGSPYRILCLTLQRNRIAIADWLVTKKPAAVRAVGYDIRVIERTQTNQKIVLWSDGGLDEIAYWYEPLSAVKGHSPTPKLK